MNSKLSYWSLKEYLMINHEKKETSLLWAVDIDVYIYRRHMGNLHHLSDVQLCVCVCVGSIKYCLTPQRLNIIKRRKKNPPKLDYLFKIINWNEFDQFTIVNRSVPVSLYSYSSFDSAFFISRVTLVHFML